ncbi:three-Cys-motif partner protein TcmP [Maritalea porphyrae]|uniref:three-Cys-motif partner protein TcmP n=1 Tax=Maritalea porphyrae TaxID=880732 RepID=UPI0022AFC923|nr:three-Cys-motif partner protein TcmP [Maritalea porphyrae]MCZ4273286.1 three-Cys-motif partner protein TcmP [Maritalea porphyrae]
MLPDLGLYKDREQSYIKHAFLTQYLKAAAFKTLQGYSNVFNFVDAFAGPWKVSDEAKYSDASFDQAINTLEAVRDTLQKQGISGLKTRFCFCEANPSSVEKLKAYATTVEGPEIHIFEGKFEDNLDAISSKLTNGFTFTFIDPTGWNIQNDGVFAFLKKHRSEFMLNFMSDHINRHAGFDGVAASFGRYLVNPDWAAEFASLPISWSNERKILSQMKRAMKQAKIAKFLPDFSIMVPTKERIKMRLLFGTHSAKGLEVFRNVQQKVELQEMAVRHELRDTSGPNLFSTADYAAMEQQRKGVGCKANREKAADLILEYLSMYSSAKADQMIHLIMERVSVRKPHVNAILCDLRSKNKIAFDLPYPKRVPQKDTEIALARD